MRRYGIIGRPLGHSASPAHFAAKFAREGIDARYDAWELASVGELPTLLAAHPDLRGLNVTIPYKRSVVALLDSLTPEAEAVWAVNCIRREADGQIGRAHV